MEIHQTVTFNSPAQSVYDALTSSKQFSVVTSAPAEIPTDEGDVFTCFSGQISGRHIELERATRIVQAWRVANWPEGVYSIVRFDLSESGDTTTLKLTHTGYPDEAGEHLEGGWHKMYWEPLRDYLEK